MPVLAGDVTLTVQVPSGTLCILLDTCKVPMKKIFKLSHPKIKYARLVETARSDIRKYIKRERKRDLPEGVDFWDFDCKFGLTAEEAEAVHMSDIGKRIDVAEEKQVESFYVEVEAKPGRRTKKPVVDS